jgi:hypothetical protein
MMKTAQRRERAVRSPSLQKLMLGVVVLASLFNNAVARANELGIICPLFVSATALVALIVRDRSRISPPTRRQEPGGVRAYQVIIIFLYPALQILIDVKDPHKSDVEYCGLMHERARAWCLERAHRVDEYRDFWEKRAGLYPIHRRFCEQQIEKHDRWRRSLERLASRRWWRAALCSRPWYFITVEGETNLDLHWMYQELGAIERAENGQWEAELEFRKLTAGPRA